MKVDIIIRAKNGHDFTKRCVESIRANTPRDDYRLILVDDGSIPPYSDLDIIMPYVTGDVLIRHTYPKGAVSATNSGLAIALMDNTAPYVAIFDNDTEVPAGDSTWLDRFIAALEASPRTGCVGATTNFANPPQHVLTTPETYTAKWEKGIKDNPAVVWFVSFACLLRKTAMLQLGFWDTQFDPGNWEDTDYAVRLREAGWEIRVAQSVYIHHRGHKTFGPQLQELLQVNGKKFREKHGLGKLWDMGIVESKELMGALR